MAKARQRRFSVPRGRAPTWAQHPVTAHEHHVQHRQGKERINRLFLGNVAENQVGRSFRGLIRLSPLCGFTRPSSPRSSVVLPAPLGPTRPTKSPASSPNRTFRRTTVRPYPKSASCRSISLSLVTCHLLHFLGKARSNRLGSATLTVPDRLFQQPRRKPESSSFPWQMQSAAGSRQTPGRPRHSHCPRFSRTFPRSAQSNFRAAR